MKVLAEEIRHIKKEKQKMMEDKENYKPKNKIRIKYGEPRFNARKTNTNTIFTKGL